MEKIIIGVHGLRNKPPKNQLTAWWKKSIQEGFKAVGRPVIRFRFEMAYWAHHLHSKPQSLRVKNPKHPLMLWEPYVPGEHFGPRDPERFRKRLISELRRKALTVVTGKPGFRNTRGISDLVLRTLFKELDIYYHKKLVSTRGLEKTAKEVIRKELERLLWRHRNKKVMVIAHSMGTVLTYDVLMRMPPEAGIHSLVTLGSPLGFPIIVTKTKEEQKIPQSAKTRLPTPENIEKHWHNLSDLEDVTSLRYNLRNLFSPNSKGVRPFDEIVYNNYTYRNTLNPHKSYGYLRTMGLTRAVENFLLDR